MVEPLPAFLEDIKNPETIHTDLIVIGGGPGGYTAAFRAADLGKSVVIVDKRARLGGVCLNVGCIPSKALLHVAETINHTAHTSDFGVSFAKPEIDLEKINAYKSGVTEQLTDGLAKLAKLRNVTVIQGGAIFSDSHSVEVATDCGMQRITFDHAIIAAGSSPVAIPSFPKDERIMDSTGALELKDIPETMLVIGGGIIGLEMATVYQALGTKVTIVELMKQIIPPADKDMIMPVQKPLKERCEAIYTETKVTAMEIVDGGVKVTLEGKKAPESLIVDKVLVSVGRKPNGGKLNAGAGNFKVDERGFIPVNENFQTDQSHIYAIGDIIGQPMLAHKAVHEGKQAAEHICGVRDNCHLGAIPSVAYTDPELAWIGLTEKEAKEQGIPVKKASIPWGACGRALATGASNGKTKLLFHAETEELVGAAIAGKNAGELISAMAVAMHTKVKVHELAEVIQAHPTLAETLGFAAEMVEGTITDLMPPKR